MHAELDRALQSDDPEPGVHRILAANANDPERVDMIRDRLNSAGYAAAFADRLEASRDILALATRLFPRSATAWDSLGEITLHMGNRKKAIECYKKALAIDPEFSSAKAQLAKLLAE